MPEPDTGAATASSTSPLQELATRISHRNTGKLLDDPAGYEVMARVAADENLHYLFYRDLATGRARVDPSGMVVAIERQVRDFEMPGTGIADFAAHAQAIADAGIYDFAIHHDQILRPSSCRHWGLEGLEGLDAEGEAARALGAAPHRSRRQGRQRLARQREPFPSEPVASERGLHRARAHRAGRAVPCRRDARARRDRLGPAPVDRLHAAAGRGGGGSGGTSGRSPGRASP